MPFLSYHSFMCFHVLNSSFVFNPAVEEVLPMKQDSIEISPMGHGKFFPLL